MRCKSQQLQNQRLNPFKQFSFHKSNNINQVYFLYFTLLVHSKIEFSVFLWILFNLHTPNGKNTRWGTVFFFNNSSATTNCLVRALSVNWLHRHSQRTNYDAIRVYRMTVAEPKYEQSWDAKHWQQPTLEWNVPSTIFCLSSNPLFRLSLKHNKLGKYLSPLLIHSYKEKCAAKVENWTDDCQNWLPARNVCLFLTFVTFVSTVWDPFPLLRIRLLFSLSKFHSLPSSLSSGEQTIKWKLEK